MPRPPIAIAHHLQRAVDGGDAHGPTLPRQQVGEIGDRPGCDRRGIVQGRRGEGCFEELPGGRIQLGWAAAPPAVNQAIPPLGERALAPGPKTIAGASKHRRCARRCEG